MRVTIDPIHIAAKEGDLKGVEGLLDGGIYVNATCKYKGTPLHYAASNGRYDIVEFLLSKGAELNMLSPFIELVESNGCTVLSVRPVKGIGETALHLASKKGHADIVRLLIKSGTNTEIKDHDGKTARDIAANEEVASIFDQRSPKDPRDKNSSFFQSFSNSPIPSKESEAAKEAFQDAGRQIVTSKRVPKINSPQSDVSITRSK